MNSTQNTPVQSQNHIQALTRFVHSRLASRQNHKENRDTEISSMQLNVDAIQTGTNIPDCMTKHELQQTR